MCVWVGEAARARAPTRSSGRDAREGEIVQKGRRGSLTDRHSFLPAVPRFSILMPVHGREKGLCCFATEIYIYIYIVEGKGYIAKAQVEREREVGS